MTDITPFGKFIGIRLTPPGTAEFSGYLYGTTAPAENVDLYTADQVRELLRLTGEDVQHLSEVLLVRDQVIQEMIEKLNRTEAMRDALERYGAMRAVCDAVGKYITVHDGVDWESNDVVYPGPELKVIDALRKLRELEKCHD